MPVRKHRAPKSALRRRLRRRFRDGRRTSQKAPSAKRCIKTELSCFVDVIEEDGHSQKAPSAKRRIKTIRCRASARHGGCVRKHRAPKGALRHVEERDRSIPVFLCQKAPSTKRRIKTIDNQSPNHLSSWSESTERQKVH